MTREELDWLWQRAMNESVQDGEKYIRYHFAALVAEKEREACAEVCGEIESDMWAQYMGRGKYAGVPSSKIGSADIAGNSDGACKCAEAIRARGV